jgi:hypothetical protein
MTTKPGIVKLILETAAVFVDGTVALDYADITSGT